MRPVLIGAAALALAACGESKRASEADTVSDAAQTNATVAAQGGTAQEVRGASGSTATGATEPGEAASTTTPPNQAGGPPPTLPEETPRSTTPPG